MQMRNIADAETAWYRPVLTALVEEDRGHRAWRQPEARPDQRNRQREQVREPGQGEAVVAEDGDAPPIRRHGAIAPAHPVISMPRDECVGARLELFKAMTKNRLVERLHPQPRGGGWILFRCPDRMAGQIPGGEWLCPSRFDGHLFPFLDFLRPVFN